VELNWRIGGKLFVGKSDSTGRKLSPERKGRPGWLRFPAARLKKSRKFVDAMAVDLIERKRCEAARRLSTTVRPADRDSIDRIHESGLPLARLKENGDAVVANRI
jgi:hypothetical protein